MTPPSSGERARSRQVPRLDLRRLAGAARAAVVLAALGGSAGLAAAHHLLPAAVAGAGALAYVGVAGVRRSGGPVMPFVADAALAALASGALAAVVRSGFAAVGVLAALPLCYCLARAGGAAQPPAAEFPAAHDGLAASRAAPARRSGPRPVRGVEAGVALAFAAGAPAAVATAWRGEWAALGTVALAAAAGGLLALAGGEAHESVAVATQAAGALEERRTELVTTVSHELRTPLTLIQGITDTLAQRWDVLSEPAKLDLIDKLTENVASLDASVLHFVDASRLQHGSFALDPKLVDAAEVLRKVTVKLAASLAGHDLESDLAVRHLVVDEGSLGRIFEHLLVNAARFSPLGTPIRVRVTVEDGQAVVSVTDRGRGLTPQALATAWSPLERGDVKDTGISRGAGLGLPIVRELARLHGGDAELRSVKGHGTTVWVRWPQPG